ncbi:MAG: Methyltransferase [Candidatus Nomurabacteria bacterium]|nr:Methyltransferase [Candidatus Nomurabacteria bacterium]
MPLYSDELSETYAQNRANYKATDKEVFSHIERIGIKDKKVLDFGCGDGVYAEEFIKLGAREIVGIDDAPKMIELAKSKHPAIQFIEADGNNLPFEERAFDLTFAFFVLHHFVDTLKPLKEIYRVLKKDGYLVATMGAYEIPEGLDLPLNTPAPIRLGISENTTLVTNILKSYKKVEKDLKDAGFEIDTYKSIENANARMDETHPYKDKVKLLTMLIVAKKT